jgi:succinate dehydrogenase / fumarate reductase, iron-sulfur subunit
MTQTSAAAERGVLIRIKRQDGPGKAPRWEEFSVPSRPNLNIISCLQWIAAHPALAGGKATTPPAWESGCLEEICGSCTMVINGRVRQACSALVEKIAEPDAPITIEPLAKFPVVRDLMVDRRRLDEGLQRVKAWVPIDGAFDQGPGPASSRKMQENRYALSRCIGCGCCVEACPQYTTSNKFVGAAVISQARLFNEHPVGAELKTERLDALMEEGGIQDCAKSGNCLEVCPKDIPLLESIASMQRQATVHTIGKFFSA